jgi:hypothetical protein
MTTSRVAVHEAGHAVAMVLLGIGLRSVTIIPDDEALGRTVPAEVPDEYDDGFEKWLQAKCVSLLAGHEAERRVADAGEVGIESVVDDDWYEVGGFALSLAGQSGGERMVVLQNRWLAEARVLLARNWSMVERVAGELQRRGTLSGSEVSEILDGGRGPTPD